MTQILQQLALILRGTRPFTPINCSWSGRGPHQTGVFRSLDYAVNPFVDDPNRVFV